MFTYLSRTEDYQSRFVQFVENNVYDSYKVTEQVILNSFTVVSQVLSTQRILIPYK